MVPRFSGILFMWLGMAAANVQIFMTPPSFQPGVTNRQTVNCTFPMGSEFNMTTVFSIILSKADSQNSTEFQELASISAFDSGNPVNLGNSGVASGHMGLFHDPYLSLEWSNPAADIAGYYHCAANGMDNIGHPIAYSKTVQLATYSGGSGVDPSIQAQIDDLVRRVSILEKSRTELFEISQAYMNHRYYLSKGVWRNVDVAESMCELFNGYLVEIDDFPEFQFISNFLNQYNNVGAVLIGHTDEIQEGQWSYRYSGRPVTYSNWYGAEPDVANHDCVLMYGFEDWKMFDFECYGYDGEHNRNYLCEVPN